MTDEKDSKQKPQALKDRELDQANGGYLSVELENTLISSFKDDRKPGERGFGYNAEEEAT